MQLTRTGKSHYSETEAAEELGISTEQLRTMIRSHVIVRDEDLTNVPWGRPVGVTVAPDGSLLVTDDGSKSIWRISYTGK